MTVAQRLFIVCEQLQQRIDEKRRAGQRQSKIDVVSPFKRAGFLAGESCADANTGGWRAHVAARLELHCDSVLLNCQLHPRR
jgi:hypothetical protein